MFLLIIYGCAVAVCEHVSRVCDKSEEKLNINFVLQILTVRHNGFVTYVGSEYIYIYISL